MMYIHPSLSLMYICMLGLKRGEGFSILYCELQVNCVKILQKL